MRIRLVCIGIRMRKKKRHKNQNDNREMLRVHRKMRCTRDCYREKKEMITENKEPKLTKELFENPSAQFRGAPFWAWNTDLSEKELL